MAEILETQQHREALLTSRALESIDKSIGALNRNVERFTDGLESVGGGLDQYFTSAELGGYVKTADQQLRGMGSYTQQHAGFLPIPMAADVRGINDGLAEAQRAARIRRIRNPWGCAIINNRISYTVGSGHGMTVCAEEENEAKKEIVETWVKDTRHRINWHDRQQEKCDRNETDGECFIWYKDVEGRTEIRFIEPWRVRKPTDAKCREILADNGLPDLVPDNTDDLEDGADYADCEYGIVTAWDDFEDVLGFIVDEKTFIPADEMEHSKRNVGSHCKRGMPTLFGPAPLLDRANHTAGNVAKVSDFQADIGVILESVGASVANIKQGIANMNGGADAQSDSVLKEDPKHPGVMASSQNIKPTFPSTGNSIDKHIAGIQFDLRSVAAMVVMPEYMLTADASNNNQASALVAESPSHKNFQRLQGQQIAEDRRIWEKLAAKDIESNESELTQEAWDAVELQFDPPVIQTRDPAEEAETASLNLDSGITSHVQEIRKSGHDVKKLMEEELMWEDFQIELAKKRAERDAILNPQPEEPAGGDDDDDEQGGSNEDDVQ